MWDPETQSYPKSLHRSVNFQLVFGTCKDKVATAALVGLQLNNKTFTLAFCPTLQ